MIFLSPQVGYVNSLEGNPNHVKFNSPRQIRKREILDYYSDNKPHQGRSMEFNVLGFGTVDGSEIGRENQFRLVNILCF